MSEFSTDQKFPFLSVSIAKSLSRDPPALSLQECTDQQDMSSATESINKVVEIILRKQKNVDVML